MVLGVDSSPEVTEVKRSPYPKGHVLSWMAAIFDFMPLFVFGFRYVIYSIKGTILLDCEDVQADLHLSCLPATIPGFLSTRPNYRDNITL